MLNFIRRRLIQMIVNFFLISFLCFIIMQLPPSDMLTRRMSGLKELGATEVEATLQTLRKIYHMDKSMPMQYLYWISGFLRGDFGYSLTYRASVKTLVLPRLGMTFLIMLISIFLAFIAGILLGLYSATHRYSFGDHIFTFFGILGLATPVFLLALIFLYISSTFFGVRVGGLFSPEYVSAPWSIAKVVNLLKHLWMPVLIIAAYHAAGLIRIMRTHTLDILQEQYVLVARSKGLKEKDIIRNHVFKIAVNPLISIMGMKLSQVISDSIMVSIVLTLPTVGPLLLEAFKNQDMYLGGAILMIMIVLLLVGNFLADIILAYIDPRIRYN